MALLVLVACSHAKPAHAPPPEVAIGVRSGIPCRPPDRLACQAKCNAGDRESCFRQANTVESLRALCDRGMGKACFRAADRDESISKEERASQVERSRTMMARDCDAGDGDACMQLAAITKEPAAEELRVKGREAYTRACNEGDAQWCAYRGFSGGDPDQANKALDRACELGDATACSLPSFYRPPR